MMYFTKSSDSSAEGSAQGTAVLDFGTGNSYASVVVTGVSAVAADSVIITSVRIEATPEHTVDDLIYDPIRVGNTAIVAGVGFTVFGIMDDASADGTYNINWIVR